MVTKENLSPGSYAIIRWSSMESEEVCKILGYRRDTMIIRTSSGEEKIIDPRSAMVIGLKEIKQPNY